MVSTSPKRSLNLPPNLNARIEAFLRSNPGMTFTFVTIHALERWLDEPEVHINKPSSRVEPKSDGSSVSRRTVKRNRNPMDV